MTQSLLNCPFCDAPAYRTRCMFWMHVHGCMRKKLESKSIGGVNIEESAVVYIADSQFWGYESKIFLF